MYSASNAEAKSSTLEFSLSLETEGGIGMEEMVLLKPKLTRLKMSGVLETLKDRLDQAMKDKWSYSQFLDCLLCDEVERRDYKQLCRRLSKSGLDPVKSMETFDFSFNPCIHEPTIRELASCFFIERKELSNACLMDISRRPWETSYLIPC
jgi:DNA replication protein DnaC